MRAIKVYCPPGVEPPLYAFILLMSFIKRQPRDTKKALDQSLYILSDIQQHPDRTSNFDFQREATA